ncbi:MAG: hypothetical protein KIT09_13095 [Bryobacteraceae bacterium]|nr:hypothetical protein [Bryobacteraceae bacterium]
MRALAAITGSPSESLSKNSALGCLHMGPVSIASDGSSAKDGVQKRTLANLSHWNPDRVEALRHALRGEFDHLVCPDPTIGLLFGLLFVLKQLADSVGLTAALGRARLAKFALFLVLARIAHQGSRLSAVRSVRDHYVSLQKVERDLRSMKTGLLEVRPVWVRKESRTRGHVFCCMLALTISREMERRRQQEILAALGVALPARQVMQPEARRRSLRRIRIKRNQLERKTSSPGGGRSGG